MHICIVNIPPGDRSIGIDSPRKGTLVEACTRARSIERGDCPIPIEQEPVIHKVRVNEDSQNASVRRKAAAICTLARAGAAARNIECGDGALRIPQEAMNRGGCVKIESRGISSWADREALRPLADSCARSRCIECGDDSILISQESVPRTGRIDVISRDSTVGLMRLGLLNGKVPWPAAVPAPGASKTVITP